MCLLSWGLSACGGGGGGDDPPTVVAPETYIVSQPIDCSVVEGESARFEIVVNGDAELQWQSAAVGSNQWTNVGGASSTSLLLPAVSTADSGMRYRVQIRSTRNAALVLFSTAASLNVTQRVLPPAILQSPTPQSAIEGDTVTFSVTASGTALAYQWMRSAGGASFVDIPGATSAMLVLQNLSLSDGDFVYRVVVSNSLQRIESTPAALTVARAPAAPFFSLQPSHAYAVTGQAMTFAVVVAGVPTPTLQWQQSNDGTTWVDLHGETRADLVTGPLTLADNATRYRVAATNTRGTVFSEAAFLAVWPAPVAPSISTQPADVTSDVNALVIFSVTVEGTPNATVQWQVSLDSATFANVSGATGPSLAIRAALADNGKRYRAVATNSVGTVESRGALLTILPRPRAGFLAGSMYWRPGETEPWFTVAASGSGLSYQWGIVSGNEQTYADVPGETGTSYIHRRRPNDETTSVRVTVVNASGSDRAGATLHPAPWRTVHPLPIGDRLYGLTWADGSNLVAVGVQGSIWHSADDGQSWRAVAEGAFSTPDLYAVAYNGASDFVAVGWSGLLRRGTGGGVYWEGDRTIAGATALFGAAFLNQSTVIAVGSQSAGTQGAIYRSTDKGLNWSPAIGGGETPPLYDVAFSEVGIGLAVGGSGQIMRSINDGAQWLPVPSLTRQYLRSVVWVSDTTAVVAGDNSTILHSTDAGLTWQTATTGGSTDDIKQLHIARSGQGAALTTNAGNILRTTDAGATWTPNPVVPAGDVQVKFSADGTRAVSVGRSGLVRRSVDGGATWSINPSGSDEPLFGVAFADADHGVAVGVDGRMLRTTNGGDDWNLLPSATLQLQDIAFADSTTGVAVGIDGLVLRSTDGGASWAPIPSGSRQFLNSVAFATPSVGVITSTYGMLRTTDGGRTWAPPSGDTPSSLLGVAFADASIGIAVGPGGAIKRTTDGGQNWMSVESGTTKQLQSVCFADSTTAYVAGSAQTYLRSTDGGATWALEFGRSGLNMYGVACKSSGALAVGNFTRFDFRAHLGQEPAQWTEIGPSKGETLFDVALVGTDRAIAVGSGGLIIKLKLN
jgi:photosystem II stability/assembly factor-like uncharacterized protein